MVRPYLPWSPPSPIALGLMVLLAAACSLPPAPAPLSEDSAAIGIRVETHWIGGSGVTEYPDKVYFIRLHGDGALGTQRDAVPSNYRKGRQVYLLNAKPGRYVVVASSNAYGRTGTRRSLDALSGLGDYEVYTTYYDEALIQKTAVEVKAGGFAVVGSFVVEMDREIRYGTRTQKHFYLVLEPIIVDPFGIPIPDPDNSIALRGKLIKDRSGKSGARKFLEQARSDLKGAAWARTIERGLKAAGAN